MQYQLYCFRESGFSYKVALLLNLLEIEWRPVFVDYHKGETASTAYKTHINLFGECPVLKIGEHKYLSQSAAIMLYLSEAAQRFQGLDTWQKYQINRWLFFDNHKLSSNLATHRYDHFVKPNCLDQQTRQFVFNRAKAALSILESQLSKHHYVAETDSLSIADIAIAGYLMYPAAELAFSIESDFPAIHRLVEEIKALTHWASPDDLMPISAN